MRRLLVVVSALVGCASEAPPPPARKAPDIEELATSVRDLGKTARSIVAEIDSAKGIDVERDKRLGELGKQLKLPLAGLASLSDDREAFANWFIFLNGVDRLRIDIEEYVKASQNDKLVGEGKPADTYAIAIRSESNKEDAPPIALLVERGQPTCRSGKVGADGNCPDGEPPRQVYRPDATGPWTQGNVATGSTFDVTKPYLLPLAPSPVLDSVLVGQDITYSRIVYRKRLARLLEQAGRVAEIAGKLEPWVAQQRAREP